MIIKMNKAEIELEQNIIQHFIKKKGNSITDNPITVGVFVELFKVTSDIIRNVVNLSKHLVFLDEDKARKSTDNINDKNIYYKNNS